MGPGVRLELTSSHFEELKTKRVRLKKQIFYDLSLLLVF